ncbi:alpha-N-acetylneuraminide alpha-2,8-sialyltransferase-like isoform X1 [Branchiostoma floridae]|uniref:Alpha-N-acetylneuraminide alpha-2,8-sialyltransferase-like isoform X1 n=1 Tax=Branchiostoma floridae TaxID=7739 RepID=A0A9J7KC14_BRAFL|nr:alpha-N-acetylneuraminide alpha-2,8-sialyltransferase-like isoform X1 [Branchiostoma floridae]
MRVPVTPHLMRVPVTLHVMRVPVTLHVMRIRLMLYGVLLTGAATLMFMMKYTQTSIATRTRIRAMHQANVLTYVAFPEVPFSPPKEIPKFVLDIMKNATERGWSFNQTAIKRLRLDLERECNTSATFVITRKNQPVNSTFKYLRGGSMRLMTPALWEKMPEDVPFARKRLKRCSIVGSSTILINSSCGEFIDSSDMIVRFNFAPMKAALADDIGTRTTLMVANGDSIRYKFGHKVSASRFVHAVLSYGSDYSILVNPFSSKMQSGHSLLVYDRLRRRTNHTVYHFHPAWPARTNKFWDRRRVFGRDKSTGFKIASAALVFCDEVNLLGFWPYLVDLQGRKIPFHYYEKGKHGFSKKWHNMDSEFRRLFRMYSEGIINIVTGKCKDR